MKHPSPDINFKLFDQKLISSLSNDLIPIGLGSGKMGYSIYLYCLGRIYDDKYFELHAEDTLDDIFLNIRTEESLSLLNGLSGIGLGINYLVKGKYVEGNINRILRDIDDLIFIKLSYLQNHKELTPLVIIHLLFYLSIRLKDQKKGSEQEYLFKELAIQTINILYERIDLSFFEEPSAFTLDYQLPSFLYLLSQVYKQHFYNYRIDKIIDELTPKILSILPSSHANRLFLLWGMSDLQKETNSRRWKDHILLLVDTLDMDVIATDELRDKSIFFKDGLTGIYLLAENVKDYFPKQEISNFKEKILNKILHSQVWKMMENDPYFSRKTGLFDGYCGVSLLLQTINHRQL